MSTTTRPLSARPSLLSRKSTKTNPLNYAPAPVPNRRQRKPRTLHRSPDEVAELAGEVVRTACDLTGACTAELLDHVSAVAEVGAAEAVRAGAPSYPAPVLGQPYMKPETKA